MKRRFPLHVHISTLFLTLILIVMLLNLAGRLIAKRFAPKTGR